MSLKEIGDKEGGGIFDDGVETVAMANILNSRIFDKRLTNYLVYDHL